MNEGVTETLQTASVYDRWPLPILGFRNYWYPALKSQDLRGKPVRIQMLGEWLVVWRDRGKPYALVDRCAHRGARLSEGRVQFPGTGTISCPYHGWTFDGGGQCRAAIVEGPGSPLPPKVRVRSFPIEERHGVVWAWMGEGAPVSLDEDLPKPFHLKDVCVNVHVTRPWPANWRTITDNFVDDMHARYLHRGTPKFILKRIRAWGTVGAKVTKDGRGIVVKVDEDQKALLTDREQATYPGLGKFPRFKWWRYQKKAKKLNQVAPDGTQLVEGGNTTLLPGIAMIPQFSALTTFFQWTVPIDERHTRNFCFLVAPRTGLARIWFRLRHFLIFQWTQNRVFIGQDKKMTSGQDQRTEKLSASDIPVIVWRRFALENARGFTAPRTSAAITDEAVEVFTSS